MQEDYTAWLLDKPEFEAEAEAIVEAEIEAVEDLEKENERWHRDFVQVY